MVDKEDVLYTIVIYICLSLIEKCQESPRLSRVVHIDDKVNSRIAKASTAFGHLRGSVWDERGIKLDIKLTVYRSMVLPTLLYAYKTLTLYGRHAIRLNPYVQAVLENF